ncbi:MAG: response regulator [Cyanobacteria bacterium P01_E01_bin.6]
MKHRILIVEDEPRIASFIEKGLRKNGFSTQVVCDGEQALQATKFNAYDIILLDLLLPEKDGWTVLKELQQEGCKSSVIVVTALDNTKQEIFAAGAQDAIQKPFHFKDLLDAVNRQIEAE